MTVLVLILYASVWLSGGRPPSRWTGPGPDPLVARSRTIPARRSRRSSLSREAFRREFGWAMRDRRGRSLGRVRLALHPKGLLGLYVSRTDRLVLVRLRSSRPLLVTPEGDERFVAALRAVSRG
jgi:hypothetical protein